MCDGVNNKKRNHLVAIVILVISKPYPTQTLDNSAKCLNGALVLAKLNLKSIEFKWNSSLNSL